MPNSRDAHQRRSTTKRGNTCQGSHLTAETGVHEQTSGRGRRLSSWKAIAQYLGRDVRSVQRWELERGLPVHRVPGDKGGAVFAYQGELDRWLAAGDRTGPGHERANSPPGQPVARTGNRFWFAAVIGSIALAIAAAAWLTLLPRLRPAERVRVPSQQSPSIAVLPMLNLSGDRAQDYFADGFTDELVTELAQIRALRVISRTSTMVYRGSRKPLPQIARELGVRYVLEGSVAHVDQRVRVIAQLIDASTDTHVSARTYNADLKDVFEIQSRISRAIADDVRLDLSPGEKLRLAAAKEIDPAAHDLYLKAGYAYAQQATASIKQSLALYGAAAAKSPAFAAAYVGIAQAEYALLSITAESPDEAVPRIREALAKALAIDPHLGEAHGLLAVLAYWQDRDWPQAEREYRLALAEGAQSPTQRHFGADLITRGRFDEGMAHLETAVELDPLAMAPRMSEFFGYYFQRKYAEAREVLDMALTLSPDFLAGHALRGLDAMMQQDCTATSNEAEWLKRHFPSPLAEFEFVLLAVCRGDTASARERLSRMDQSKGPSFASPYQMALGYSAIGDREKALSYVEKSVDAHEGQATYLKVEPLFDTIHSDPRFIALERRMGLLE